MAGSKKYWILVAFTLFICVSFITNWISLPTIHEFTKQLGKSSFRTSDTFAKSKGFCSSKTDTYWQEGFDDENNTAWPWNLTDTWNCPNYFYNQYTLYRRKASLDCTTGSPHLVYTMTDSPNDIQVIEPDNKCLISYIKNCCHDDGMKVPNVMNYIWYADKEVGFYTFTSFISVIRFMRPCIILFHGPYIPKGAYWNFVISVFPNVIHVNKTLIHEIFGQKLKYKEHGSDLMRIGALQQYGGLYLDWDQVLLKPVDPLRKYSFTMSLETPVQLGNQFIMAEKNATFLTHYYNGYKNYSTQWAFNSIQYPFIVAKNYPELINILPYSGLKPKQKSGAALWHSNSDWSNNYALHLYLRGFRARDRNNMVTIRHENTTIGAACRRILFGKKEICE